MVCSMQLTPVFAVSLKRNSVCRLSMIGETDPLKKGNVRKMMVLNAPDLGAELWAYIPYNLHPHLGCLVNKDYVHKYYVDLKPRVFDVQIFQEENDVNKIDKTDDKCIHPNGWGTILVGGLRFGGSPNLVNSIDGTETYNFISSYFILDITNPEKRPVLLGELTGDTSSVDLGYSTVLPTLAISKLPMIQIPKQKMNIPMLGIWFSQRSSWSKCFERRE